MKAVLALLGSMLAFAASAAAPAKRASAQSVEFRNWLVKYLSNDTNDDDLANLVYGYALVDLDGDGHKEAVVWARDANLCGTSGCAFEIFVHRRSRWRLLGDGPTTRPPIKVLSSRTHGWRDLSSLQFGGGVGNPLEVWERRDARGYGFAMPSWKVPRGVHGRVIIKDATIPLFPSKCKRVTEVPSVFGPMPMKSANPGRC